MKTKKQNGNEILTTKFQYKKKHDPSFCDLTLGKEETSYNQNLSNLYILSKKKRPFKQLEPSLEKNSKEQKQCSNQKTIIWIQVMDNTLTNIKLENTLSITQNTIVAFQKQHPNLNLTLQQISQHWT